MEYQEQHEMVVVNTYESGAQEWYCPTCGRRYVLQWPPNYSRIVLEPGDEQVIHVGGSGGAETGPSKFQADNQMESSFAESESIPVEGIGSYEDIDDPYLSVWSDFIGDLRL